MRAQGNARVPARILQGFKEGFPPVFTPSPPRAKKNFLFFSVFLKKALDKTKFPCYNNSRVKHIGELCNGSTTDSDSVCWGSNPYSPAKERQTIIRWSVFLSLTRIGIRTRREQGASLAEENSPVDCFRRRGQRGAQRRGERARQRSEKSLFPVPRKRWLFSFVWLGNRGSEPQRRRRSLGAGFESAPQSDRRSRTGGKACSADFAIGERRKPDDMQGFRLGDMQACGLMISNASH